MLNIVLFGPPGAGKGTQAKNIIEKYNLVSLATGDLLRSEMLEKTPLGIEIQASMDRGEYASDSVVIKMIKDKITENKKSASGFVFDGFPRTTKQAESLDDLLVQTGYSIDKMIALDVEKDILVSRIEVRGLESGRPEDQNREIIERRLKIYNNTTASVKEFYQKQNKFYSVNGIGEINEVFDRICKLIES